MFQPHRRSSTGAPSSGRPATSGFRGDVQGLRAIAVLVVIAGHAGLVWVPGGFVGVDVFFVISGYLISHLLFREVSRSGGISLRDFYARRARRILPAATVVLVVTVLAGALWLSVIDLLSLATDAVWATLFAANLRFSLVGTDYFAQEEAPSALQHYWSLAVEEQFYLVWPLLLLACLAFARARGTSRGGRRARRPLLPKLTVFTVLLGVVVVSFGYGVWLTSSNPTAAYFSTPARAWELAIGAALALVAPTVAGRFTARTRGSLAALGLVMIALACVLYSDGTAFPGTAALLPVLGSALVLLAGAGGQESQPWPIRALAVRPMRVVGDWSYSLYLWHWPLLVIPATRAGEPLSPVVTTLLVVLVFLLAALTYRFVEQPFRTPRLLPRFRALALYPVSAAVVVVSCLAVTLYGQWQAEGGDNPTITVANSGIESTGIRLDPDPTVALVQASVVAARESRPIPSDLEPSLLDLRDDVPAVDPCDYQDDDVRELCARGDVDADRSIVVLGNSHGRMWIPAFERIAERAGYRTYYLVKPNCTGADVLTNDLSQGNVPWEACSEFRDWAFDQVAEIQPELAVVATSGPNPMIYTDDGDLRQGDDGWLDAAEAGYASTFERLEPNADRVALLRDVPKNPGDPAPCLTTGDPDLGACLFSPLAEQETESDASVAAAEDVGVEVVDPTRWICWDDSCPVVVGNMLTYRDRGHLTQVYAGSLGDEIGKALGLWTD